MQDEMIDLRRLGLIIKRQLKVILITTSVFLALAILYLMFTTPTYTAKTLLFLDRTVTQTVSEISAVKQMAFEKSAIESEVEVVRSLKVTDAVIDKLAAKGHFPKLKSGAMTRNQVAQKLLRGLSVSREGETYVLAIRYTSESPEMAADAANLYAETYIEEQLGAISDISARMMVWLENRIDDIGDQMEVTQKKLNDVRAQYNEQQREKRGSPESLADSDNDITLTEVEQLEKELKTYTSLFDSYSERLETISTQQSLPISEARVITYAVPPEGKSHPKTKIILGIAIIFGGGLGVLIALIRDNFDKSLKRAGQVHRELRVPFLGFFPVRTSTDKRALKFHSKVTSDPIEMRMSAIAIDNPFSLQSETIRTIRHNLDQKLPGKKKKVIGVISIDENEGKSVVASNIALYFAMFSTSLLLDMNIKETAKRHNAIPGLEDILLKNESLDAGVLYSDRENLSLLAPSPHDISKVLPYLSVDNVKTLLEECKDSHDYVVVDLPHLSMTADVYGFVNSVDYLVVVAEWGKTQSTKLSFYLKQNGISPDKILGVVLENADIQKLKKHHGYKS